MVYSFFGLTLGKSNKVADSAIASDELENSNSLMENIDEEDLEEE